MKYFYKLSANSCMVSISQKIQLYKYSKMGLLIIPIAVSNEFFHDVPKVRFPANQKSLKTQSEIK